MYRNAVFTLSKIIQTKDYNLLSKLYKTLDMPKQDFFSSIDVDHIWFDMVSHLQSTYPNPKGVSLYYARKELGVNDNTIKRLNTTLIEDPKTGDRLPLLRSVNEGAEKRYAEPDIKFFAKFRAFIQELEDKEVFKNSVVDGERKYLVLDTHAKGKTLDEFKIEILARFMKSNFGDLYDFVPKKPSLPDFRAPLESAVKSQINTFENIGLIEKSDNSQNHL